MQGSALHGDEDFLHLWVSWRKAGGRLSSSKAKTYDRWAAALRYRTHGDACTGKGRCSCQLEVSGPTELRQRGEEYLAVNADDPAFIADLAAWLNPKPPGDKPVKFARGFLDWLKAKRREEDSWE
jgi:hypothetical protein